MDEFPRQKLSAIIDQYGKSIIQEHRRLESLLTYVCDNQYPLETHLLMAALEDGIAQDLMEMPDGIPATLLMAQLIQRLQADMGLTEEAARWAVESWALVLGVDLPNSVTEAESTDALPPIDLSAQARVWLWHLKNFPGYFLQQSQIAWALMVDARVPIRAKLIPILAVAYIVSPLGLIVDLIPVAGLLANLAIYMLALALFNSAAPAALVEEHTLRLLRKRRANKMLLASGDKPHKPQLPRNKTRTKR